MPVVDFAPTRTFRQARQARTPAAALAAIALAPTTRGGLAHPRLVRRAPSSPGPAHHLDHGFYEEEPTKPR